MSRIWSMSRREKSRIETISRPANEGLSDMASEPLWVTSVYNSVCRRGAVALRIVAATSDLFLKSRIAELAQQTGAEPFFATTPEDVKRLVAENRPELVILDLSSTEYDPFAVARELRSKYNSRLFGLYPHVQAQLKKNADQAGFEYVVPNSSFLIVLRKVMLERAEDD